tara:strand:- start:141 stop:572 length:432 start_codon:yes stop_codon:yes gene_type:complete
MTSELLDDYEEGTWTPALAGTTTAGNTTYTTQTGEYTRIGRLVTAVGKIIVNSQGTLDGNVSIINLPFTSSANATANYGYVTFSMASSLLITATESLNGFVSTNSTVAYLHIWNASGGTDYLDDAELTDGADLNFGITYFVAT